MFDTDLLARTGEFFVLAEQIAAAVTTEVDGPLAAEALTDVLAAVRLGELATCRLIERVDRTGQFAADGSASTAGYVRNLSGESGGWASGRVLLGRALADRMPATSAAWERGELGLGHAQVIREATSTLEAALAGEIERVLADAAPNITPRQLSDLAATVKAAAAPEDSEATARKNRDAQQLKISKTFDGMYRVDGWLDTEAGAEVAAAIEAFTRHRDPELSPFDDPIGRRRADALLQLARHATAHADGCNGDGPPRHSLIVATSLETLQSGIGAGDIQGGGTLTAGAVRRLACDAGIIPAVLNSRSEILDLGTQVRLATPAIRRKLGLRDGGCLFPGCDRPPATCEAHHRDHYIDGGPTSDTNMDLFCTFHHHLVHEGGWTYKTISARELHFFPPSGGPVRVSHRRPLVTTEDLSKRLDPAPTVRVASPRRT